MPNGNEGVVACVDASIKVGEDCQYIEVTLEGFSKWLSPFALADSIPGNGAKANYLRSFIRGETTNTKPLLGGARWIAEAARYNDDRARRLLLQGMQATMKPRTRQLVSLYLESAPPPDPILTDTEGDDLFEEQQEDEQVENNTQLNFASPAVGSFLEFERVERQMTEADRAKKRKQGSLQTHGTQFKIESIDPAINVLDARAVNIRGLLPTPVQTLDEVDGKPTIHLLSAAIELRSTFTALPTLRAGGEFLVTSELNGIWTFYDNCEIDFPEPGSKDARVIEEVGVPAPSNYVGVTVWDRLRHLKEGDRIRWEIKWRPEPGNKSSTLSLLDYIELVYTKGTLKLLDWKGRDA